MTCDNSLPGSAIVDGINIRIGNVAPGHFCPSPLMAVGAFLILSEICDRVCGIIRAVHKRYCVSWICWLFTVRNYIVIKIVISLPVMIYAHASSYNHKQYQIIHNV